MTRFLLLFLLPLLAGGGAIAIENDGFRATFADPSDETLGFRFFRAGWVRGLYPAAGETSLFHTRTLFDYHPAFGCAQEFLPDLPLASGDRLKPGVGIFRLHPKDYFRSRPVRSFPWEWSIRDRSLIAHQSCPELEGYAYELSITVTVGKNMLVWKQQLTNTGTRRIDGQVYLHPFFATRDGFAGWWYSLDGTPHSVADAPESQSVENGQAQAAAGTDQFTVNITSCPPFRRRDFWRNQSNAFAVEPYIPVSLAPGETRIWKWCLALTRFQKQ